MQKQLSRELARWYLTGQRVVGWNEVEQAYRCCYGQLLSELYAFTCAGIEFVSIVFIPRGGEWFGRKLYSDLLRKGYSVLLSPFVFVHSPDGYNFPSEGNFVLLVDDIVDTGRTYERAVSSLIRLYPKTPIRFVCLYLRDRPDYYQGLRLRERVLYGKLVTHNDYIVFPWESA